MADITNRIEWILEQNVGELGLKYIAYGIHDTIPKSPAAIIEPGRKLREWRKTGSHTNNAFEVAIFHWFTGLGSESELQKALDPKTELIEKLIDTDALPTNDGGTRFNGLLIEGLCTEVQYGYRRTDDGRMRVNRIIFTGRSSTRVVV